MTEEDRRKLETNLIRSGFKGINDPELVPELAKLIPNHEVLRALLNDCERIERYAMLEALRPYLPFGAKTTEDYESMSGEKFERYELERNRIISGDQEFEKVCKELATHALITMTCQCRKKAQFAGATPLGAVILARQDGWVRDRETNKECCPKCRPLGSESRRKCGGCGRRHYAPDCRVQGKIEPGAPLVGGAQENVTRLN